MEQGRQVRVPRSMLGLLKIFVRGWAEMLALLC